MASRINRQWRLAARPVGLIKESDYKWVEEPVPPLPPIPEHLLPRASTQTPPATKRPEYRPRSPSKDTRQTLIILLLAAYGVGMTLLAIYALGR